MARTKTNRQGSWSVDAYSDSSKSDDSSSFRMTSSEDESSPMKNNRSMARNSRRPRDPEPSPDPIPKMARNSSRRKPGNGQGARKSGFGSSSDESSSRFDMDDSTSLEEDGQPPRRGGKGRKPPSEFGRPKRRNNRKDLDDDSESKSYNEDDSSMSSPPRKTTPTKLNKYVKQNPRKSPTDIEGQRIEDLKDADDESSSSFERRFSSINLGFGNPPTNQNSRNAPKVGTRNRARNSPQTHSNDTKGTNTDDSFDGDDSQSDDEKPIPERRGFLTRERKIITCLTLFLCCFCLLAALGIGIGIGIASRGSEERVVSRETAPTLPPSNDTQAPSAPPSRGLDAALLELLIENSFDDGATLLTQGTPQRSAYEWLSRNAELPNYTTEVKLARYALATFYYSTNGPSTWAENIRDGGWMTDAPECEWASTARNQCTGTIYSSLTLDFVGVSGQLPPELAYLTSLSRLSLRSEGIGSPSIAGSIPSTIGQLENLQTIRLNENNIGGTLPTSIGNLTNLRVFLMSGNSLEGSIPSEIGMTMGNTFNFDRNRLTGRLPVQLFRMGTLTALNFEDNSISGQIPRAIGSNPSLNSINFASNRLTGTIPTEFGRLVTMRSGINLSNNELAGSLPSELGFLVDMQNLLLNNNRLVGRVPPQLDTITDMRLLRLDGNLLTGEMPRNVCDSFTDRSVSYSDCASQAFQCSCCTFCCNGPLCTCNVEDESICSEAVLDLDSLELNQATSEIYYSETDEHKGVFVRDSSRRILASKPFL